MVRGVLNKHLIITFHVILTMMSSGKITAMFSFWYTKDQIKTTYLENINSKPEKHATKYFSQ